MTTNKQKAFIYEYLKDFNATQAALRAGYSQKTSYSIGQENLKKPEIAEAIQAELDEIKMSADEVLKRKSEIARGDLGDFINDFGMIDITEARKAGKTKLIKKLTTKTTITSKNDEDIEVHTQTIELYPADSELDKMARVHGLYNDLGTKNNPLTLTWKEFVQNDNDPSADSE